jgi:hypothetical protein
MFVWIGLSKAPQLCMEEEEEEDEETSSSGPTLLQWSSLFLNL